MYKILKKQRRRYHNNFIVCLFGSMMTHIIFFIGFWDRQPPQPLKTAKIKITPITIAEQPTSEPILRSPKNAASQPKPSPKPSPEVTTPPITPPQAKTPEVKTPTPPKPDLPVLTSPEPKVATQPQVKPEIKTPIEEKKTPPESSTIETKPTPNRDRQKLPLDNINKPAKNNLTAELDRERRDSVAKPEAFTPQQLPPIPAKDSSGDRPSDKKESDIEADESKTATNNIPPTPQQPLSISCKANCLPEYPDALDGVEGTAGIKLIINRQGKVIDAAIALPHENSELNQSALSAAKEMEFSQINRDRATVQINITFATE